MHGVAPAEDGRDSVQVHRGLAGVVFDRTQTTLIDGQSGTLLYRGYSIHDLAERSTFEETTYLLLHGELPTRAELDSFDAALMAARAVPSAVIEIIRSVRAAHPMDVLRTAVSAMAAFDGERPDGSAEALRRWAIRLIAQVPTLVAAHHAIRRGREPIPPSPTLSHAANLLYMLSGEAPSDRTARLLDQDMILHADHSSNASAFAARVVAGTQTDPYGALTAAIAAFAGPLHGGAVEHVMQMVQEIGEPHRAADYVAERRARNEPVMGFGHRVYRTEDPRARHLRRAARELSEEMGEPKWYAILEEIVGAMRPYAQKGVDVNVDFYAGVIYQLLGIPQDLSVPVFVAGRMPGWIAQIQEQYANNVLIRPLLQYVGAPKREYRPLTAR
jgi:citrate synthase